MKSPYQEVTIGSLASSEPGAFKIGPFGSSLKKGELISNGIPVVGIENVLPNNFNPVYRKFITPEKFEQLSQYKMEPFDVVVTTMGTVGRAAVVPENIGTAIIDSHLFRMRLNRKKVDPIYLCYALNGYAPLMNQLKEKAVGAIMAGLNTKILRECTIPLPPLTEQQRIAARLNEQMAVVAQARQAAEEQLRAARELPSAYLREVFEGQEAKKWPMQRLAEVSAIGAGITLGRKLFNVQTRKVPYLRVANVKDGFLDLSDVYNIDATEADVAKCTLKYGDLLLTEGGDPDKLGRGTFWEEQFPECLHQNHIFRVRFDLAKISPRFMAYQVGSPYGKAYFLSHARQTTGIATINQKVLGNFPLLIPLFAEQEKIATVIKEKLAEAESLKQALEAQLAEINQLPSALLRRAFEGDE